MDLIAALGSFIRVAQTHSFSAVAHERGVTQPAISRQISALEDRLGVRLVQRNTQAVTLTEEGRAFLEPAQQLVQDAEDLMASVGGQGARATGRVRVAMPASLGLYFAGQLGRLTQAHPGLAVDLVSREGASNMVEDGLDLEIRLGPLADSSLVARPVGNTRAFLVATPAYLATVPALRTPADLSACNCLLYQRWGRDDTWWFTEPGPADAPGREAAVTITGSLHANNADAVYRAALAGLGVALLSHLLVAEDIRAGRLVHVLPAFPTRRFPLYALYPSSRRMPARTKAVLAFITELLADDPDMAPVVA